MESLAPSLALACLLGLALTGCDTIRARNRAHQGAEFYRQGNFQEALYKYEQAAALDGSIDTLHLNLGFTYLQLYTASPKSRAGYEYGGLAIRSFEEYLRRQPGEATARSYLTQTFVDTRRYDEAVAFFKPEIEAAQPSVEAISTVGQIAAKVGRIDDALKWYERRVALNPTDADGPYNLGVLIWDHLHNHPEVVGDARLLLANRGLVALQRAIELRPNAPEGYTYLNLVLRERATGQPDDVAKAADLAEADKNMKLALEKMKEQGPAPVGAVKR